MAMITTLASLYESRGRKRAFRSKPPKGITVKKSIVVSSDIINLDDSDDEPPGFVKKSTIVSSDIINLDDSDDEPPGFKDVSFCTMHPGKKRSIIVSSDIINLDDSDDEPPGFKDVSFSTMHPGKKRKLTESPGNNFAEVAICSFRLKKSSQVSVANDQLSKKSTFVVQRDFPSQNSEIISSPESGEIISESESRKRKTKEEYSDTGISKSVCKSRDLICGCGDINDYEKLSEISRGAFGAVYRARDRKTGEIVAVKKEFDGLSISSLREIDALKSLHWHPSIVGFKRVVADDYDGVYVVMEYMKTNLRTYLDDRNKPFTQTEVKHLMKQLLEGVHFLHGNRFVHRDLKTANILINENGYLKICDFGLSRLLGSAMTPLVVTLWYRAPELLLGAKTYSYEIDMWSVGCVMAELLSGKVLFRGETEHDQIDKIYWILGTPNDSVWPGYSSLPGSRFMFVQQPRNLLRERCSPAVLTEAGFDLLTKLLAYDPMKRITAEAALSHAWFKENPR